MLRFLKMFGLPLLVQAIKSILEDSIENSDVSKIEKIRTYILLLREVIDRFFEKTTPDSWR